MPPRISSKRLPQPQTCQCFRTRPQQERQFHASPPHATRLRRQLYAWLKGPGEAFRDPLSGSTNYLSAYDKQGNLLRARRDTRDRGEIVKPVEDEEAAARRDLEDGLSEEAREEKQLERAMQRATFEAQEEENEERGGVPRERQSDLRPYPLNRNFRSQSVLSEDLREQLYRLVADEGHDLSSVAGAFGVDVRRVAAVVRLKTIEKQWQDEGKKLATPYSEAVLSMLPQTPFRPGTTKPVTPHEPINDLPVHPHTRAQLFYPASESRQFTREDAAKAFSDKLLPADKRIPLPMLVDIERWNVEGRSREERVKLQRHLDEQKANEEARKAVKKAEWEARTLRVVPGRRWDFKFQDISAEKVGKDGRGRDAVGLRYGMPHEDRKRGMVKIPTRVE